jgi:D-glycero-alpha-D-manno-heptose-7-phosphate kinase
MVCNLAIERRATVRTTPAADSAGPVPPLIRAALHRAGITDAAVAIESDFPIGAGLGGSSAAGVALAAALAAWRGQHPDPAALAEWSRAVEVEEMGVAGGRQDHYAAAFGGALSLRFHAGGTDVERLPLTAGTVAALEQRCMLAYTGESRISGRTISAVLDAYRARVPRVVHALDRMRHLAATMRAALLAGDVDALAAGVDEHWAHQRVLHPEITTERIDALEAAARRAGAVGLKALGASGGGCVIVFRPAGDDGRVAEAIRPWATLLPWRVAATGVHVTEH